MSAYIAEFVGTFILIAFGTGVCAGVSLNKTLNKNGGWILIVLGWGLAVLLGVYASAPYSGGHLNPAVTLGLAFNGDFPWAKVPGYLIAQVLGAMLGATTTAVLYHEHFAATPKTESTLGVFATGPAIESKLYNFLSEFIGTFIFILSFKLALVDGNHIPAGAGPAIVACTVIAMGISFGGLTGYAINPARDFGPRLIYRLLPIPNKNSDANWKYAWVPIVGPICGGIVAVFVANLIGKM